ncbi:hypothetical protein GCM10010306_099890 [Streptomyces umbrinus]|uniref:lanthionine synthetase LanC family protein n=1 Tax=Streptomyces umbrinus TaxID=67370 RepID=UPI00167B93FD|nr:lanthionine synthetase LanC family protein [Streptomyces umbrinus]GHB88861.1 hypothetical protein GCM10010306_099890 [Streptomyces umbrinus]
MLCALHVSGAGDHPEQVDWLIHRLHQPGRDLPTGFYDGAHGIAHALWVLARPHEAVELVDRARAVDPDRLGSSLYGGLSGIGLNLLSFADRCDSAAYRDKADQIATTVRRRLEERLRTQTETEHATDLATPAGLMRGASGPALFMTAMFEASGDESSLDAAADALRLDLLRCVPDAQE